MYMSRRICRLLVHIGLTVLIQCLDIPGTLAMARCGSPALNREVVLGCLKGSQGVSGRGKTASPRDCCALTLYNIVRPPSVCANLNITALTELRTGAKLPLLYMSATCALQCTYS